MASEINQDEQSYSDQSPRRSSESSRSGSRHTSRSGSRSSSSSSGKKQKFRRHSSSSSSASLRANAFNIAVFLLRVTVSVCMLTHGMKKFDMLISGQATSFADPIGLGPTQSLVLAVFAEVICSILIIFGIATRVATAPLMINMLVIIFAVHSEEGFSKQELPLIYFLVYFMLLVIGPGRYSIDRYIKKLRKERFLAE